MLELNEAKSEDLLKRINWAYHFGDAERTRQSTSVAKWKDYRLQYNSEWSELTQNEDDEDLEALWFFVPKTYQHVHRIEASLLQQFFPPAASRLFKTYSESDDDAVRLAAAMLNELVHYKVDKELKPYKQCWDAWHASLVDGQGWSKLGWDNGKCRMVFVPNDHLLWDPWALTPEDISWFIHEIWLTEDELRDRERRGIYENVDELLGICKGGESSLDEWRQYVSSPDNQRQVKIRLWEYWGPDVLVTEETLVDKPTTGQRNIVATVWQNKTILRVDGNKYANLYSDPTSLERLPFVSAYPLPKGNSTYGDSMVGRLRPGQREVNKLRNQRRQSVDGEMMGKIFVDIGRVPNLKQLFDANYMGVVPVNGDPNGVVYAWHPQTTTQNMNIEEAVVDGDMIDISGIPPYKFGETPPGMPKTFGGTQALMGEGNVKMDTLVANVANSMMVPMGRFFAACIARWMKPKDVQKILRSPSPPPPFWNKILADDWLVEVEAGAGAAGKAAELRNIQFALNMWAQVAAAIPQEAVPHIIALAKRQDKLLGLPPVSPQEIQGIQQQPAPPNMEQPIEQTAQVRPQTMEEAPV